MADNISILIKAILSKTSKAELEQELKQIERNLTPINIRTSGFDNYKKALDEIIHKYKTAEITGDKLVNSFEKVRNFKGGSFWESLDPKKQEDYMRVLQQAEQLRTKTQTETANIINQQNAALQKQLEIEERISQEEYVRSMKAKIQEVELRNAAQVQSDESAEKRATQEYVNRYKALINEVELRNKIDIQQREETLEIQKQLALYKEQLAIRNQNLKTTYGKSYDSTGMPAIIASTNNLNASDFTSMSQLKDATKQLDLQIDKSTAKMREMRKEATLAMKETDGFFTTIIKDFSKMIAWSVVNACHLL
jgi:hypothetical protein